MARYRHLLLVLPLAGACTAAAGPANVDAGADAAPTKDAALDAAADGDGACGLSPDPDAGKSTWSDLYANFFGPTGAGNCSLKSGCHADSVGGGAIWICGPTKATCWQGMQANVDVCDPSASKVLFMLRKATDPSAVGKMPQEPTSVTFSDADLARVRAWIAAGAKND